MDILVIHKVQVSVTLDGSCEVFIESATSSNIKIMNWFECYIQLKININKSNLINFNNLTYIIS